ncbi:MAG: helix-turn-helix transcriptional regulator [Clostridia bacterium]|nr:helix-turn-helix transcriptional regulator [Clostridia bacterium]
MSELRMSPALTGKNGLQISVGKVFPFPIHSHSYYEMILYRPFDGFVTVNGRQIPANRPFALLMTPTDLHSVTLTGAQCSNFIKAAFTADALGGYLTKRLTGGLLAFPPEGDTILHLFEKLSVPRPHEALALLLRALVLLLAEAGETLPSAPAARSNALMAAATAIIGDEFETDLTLEHLAQRLNVSYQHLSACFLKHLGLSFSAYLSDIRLRHAGALLQSSTLSVTEICYACGYRNLSHFLRSFKKKFGVTPKTYRKG